MFVANWCVGYVAHSDFFDDEATAERWLAAELRRTGSKWGVVFEREGEE